MAKEKAASKKAAKAKKAAPAGKPNPRAVDSRGEQFDPKIHAVDMHGKPQTESGHFVRKPPKGSHYPDTFRHS